MARTKRAGLKSGAEMDSSENETAIADAADAASGDAGKTVLKKDLIEAVVVASGLKRGVVKSVVEAVLGELGEALARGEAMNLPPLGKISVNRSKEVGNADVMVVKVRRVRPGSVAEAPQADDDETDADD
jgi:DNA-binding protein HU-alpha